MAAQASITAGSQVWAEDPDEAWIDGEVVKVLGDTVTIKCTNGKTVTAKASHVHAKDPEESPCGVDDMTKLAYLHEPGVLQNLKSRYDMNEIYVRISSVSHHYSLVCILCTNIISSNAIHSSHIRLSHFFALKPDLYWKYSDCCKSFPKTSSSVRCSDDGTV
jgi:hypothetical protein